MVCLAVCLLTTSCGILGIGSKNGSASVSGQASGAALKSLYSQYQTDGQIDITNLNNIIMLAQLSNGIQGLKDVDDKSQFYNDFAQGLILGSDRLVTKNTANTVTNTLQTLVSGTDLSSIAAAGFVAAAVAEEAAQSTEAEAIEIMEDASDEVSSTLSSLTSIFGLLGK